MGKYYLMAMHINWTCKSFAHLTTTELYNLLSLRQQVFIVEQNCPYLDTDGKDFKSLHLMGMGADGELIAYARIVAPGVSYAEVSIGRVISKPAYRKHGFGKQLITEALQVIKNNYGDVDIRIGAQSYLLKFYQAFGFETLEAYMEDNIPHHIMLRKSIV